MINDSLLLYYYWYFFVEKKGGGGGTEIRGKKEIFFLYLSMLITACYLKKNQTKVSSVS